jgi:hypothetical protein
MKATASLLALAIFAIAPSTALADPYRHHHDYYKLINASSAGTAASNSFPWTSVGVALAIAAVVAVLLTTLQLTRRLHRTAP